MTNIKKRNLGILCLCEPLCVSPAESVFISSSVSLCASLFVSVAVSLSSLTFSSVCTTVEKCALDGKALGRNTDICRNGSAEYGALSLIH